jgi:WD40 repeat protein
VSAALIDTLGVTRALESHVVATHWLGEHALFALGDGDIVAMTRSGEPYWCVRAHEGAILCAAPGKHDWLTGGDDGRVVSIAPDGAVTQRAHYKNKWIEAIASHGDLIAIGAGKALHVRDMKNDVENTFDHPSTVSGVAFDPTGRRIAAAHYGGVTISWAAKPESARKELNWKGSHLSVMWSPDAKFVITTMQENALHGWRLQDGQHFRMAGYPAKIRALSFSADHKWLASAGAEELVLWPFQGHDGPINKHASVAGDMGAPCTMLACHPTRHLLAAGSDTGEIVLATLAAQGRPLLVRESGSARVTALAWNPGGTHLSFGCEDGAAGIVDFTEAMAM